MALSIADFTEFYRALYGFTPFRWQLRLLARLAETGVWPAGIDAPTGAGKSSVVDIHVYANALSAVGAGARVPRRLAAVVNRRALVDSQFVRAETLAGRLDDPDCVILQEVADALRLLGQPGGRPMRTVSLRGGQPTDRAWVDDPVTPLILAATPDMWGSRLLFRGYGTSKLARPRDAGLLAMDCVVVVDEAHLSQQLVHTATDVASIVGKRANALKSVPALQVVSATATHTESGVDTESVTEEDLLEERSLSARLLAAKELILVHEPTRLSGVRRATFIAELALEAATAVTDRTKPTVLVIVNRRATAAAVAELLAERVGGAGVACWAGRMRGMDIQALQEERPGLLTIAGHLGTAFLVATQTAEVGVDLDCAALVTELAPGAALAQRFGRINRLGERPTAKVHVLVPDGDVADSPPYRADDLARARDWLQVIETSDGDVSPWRLRSSPPPAETLRRRALSDVWPADAELLARTTSELFEEPDLAFWLRDDLDADESPVGVVLRRLPAADDAALALLQQIPIAAEELFPATLRTARAVVDRALQFAQASDGVHHGPRVFRQRGDELELIDPANQNLRPGDTVVVDHDVRVTQHNILMPDAPLTGSLPNVSQGGDVQVLLPGELCGGVDLCEALAGMSIESAQATLDELVRGGWQVRISPELVDVTGVLPWVVLAPPSVVALDEDVRQEWSRSDLPVLLDSHQAAVADRAVVFGRLLGLPAEVISALDDAGRHHDDGKQEPQFQAMLRDRSDSSQVTDVMGHLAKSIGRSSQRVKRVAARRSGWRHEQLSAAYAQSALGADEQGMLATRLVGTSHGRGRPFFPHGPTTLLDGNLAAPQPVVAATHALFRAGAGWSDVLDRTDNRFGVWGTAYLEAVLRAADCTVSGEGS